MTSSAGLAAAPDAGGDGAAIARTRGEPAPDRYPPGCRVVHVWMNPVLQEVMLFNDFERKTAAGTRIAVP
jgi:hypothetical protein